MSLYTLGMMLRALPILAFLLLASRLAFAQPMTEDRKPIRLEGAFAQTREQAKAPLLLIVPARIMPRGVEVWNLDDPWTMAWRGDMPPGAPIAINLAKGDEEDLDLLSQTQAQARDSEALRRLARKYGVQGAVLAIIDEVGVFAAEPNPRASDHVQIETLYVPVDGPPTHVMVGLTRSAESGVLGVVQQLAKVIGKLANDRAAGVVIGEPPRPLTPPPATRPAQQTELNLTPPSVAVGSKPGTAGSTVWRGSDSQTTHFIRLRVHNAAEGQMLVNKLSSIPGAKFTPIASVQGWLQGYLGYEGALNALQRELIQRGIPLE